MPTKDRWGPDQDGDVYLRAPMSAGYRYLSVGRRRCRRPMTTFRSAGDIGHLDADGYLYIIDRRVDMIITGGANVFPSGRWIPHSQATRASAT